MVKSPQMQTPKFVDFKTSDGLTLPGLLYEVKGSKKVVIFLHGNGSSSIFYDEKEYRDLPEALNKKGISILKFNNRGANIIKKLNMVKDSEVKRKPFGMAYEKIKECVPDIDGAVKFLQKLGYNEFYLAGVSTGANKICVYDHYKPKNIFKKYIMICGGDDTGIYYSMLGSKKFFKLLNEAKNKIKKGQGEELIKDLLSTEIFSYQGFYDIANPDGDYNTFPFSEAFGMAKISKKPLFRYFKSINKPSIVIYGEKDEYSWGNIKRVISTLKKYQPDFEYKIINGTDHGFTGKQKELANIIADWL
jgi:pimeloyl-ACP methyl ester carboxylesterase